jgi:putative N6-adenine-specific DNA methylase
LRSELHHTPTLQSITKKSIINKLGWWEIFEAPELPKFEILVLVLNNTARILLNLTWDALHKRWYRREAWEAPIKESLAAGLVLLSWWRFKEPFYDIFCGSWTIAIEAAMIAKNIAPWLKRKFSIVDLGFISEEKMAELKSEARSKKFDWNYRIFGSDIDEEMVRIAQKNASDAWVADEVSFEKSDYKRALYKWLEKDQEVKGCLVTNPPYGLRLEADMEWLYKSIDVLLRKNPDLKWWFISNYIEFDKFAKKDFYKKRKLYNWAEKCYFWKKK